MTSANRDALKRVFGKGNLSGFETAKIALGDMWEQEHARDHLVSELEFKKLMDRLTDREEIRVYNNWVGIFSTICEIKNIAQILSLTAEATLRRLESLLDRYIAAAVIEFHLASIPLIVTEKQLEDLKAAHKQEALRETQTLENILFFRVERQLSDTGDMLEDLLEQDTGKVCDAYRRACSEIRDMIESNHLRLSHRKGAVSFLKRIETRMPVEDILAILDPPLSEDSDLSTAAAYPILERATATGQALYTTGLPEWVEPVDHYEPEEFHGIAIVQDPLAIDLDHMGYYKVDSEMLERYFHSHENELFWGSLNLTPGELFTIKLEQTRMEVSFFLYCRAVLQGLSAVTGISFSEDVDRWYDSLDYAVDSFSKALSSARTLSTKAEQEFMDLPMVPDLAALEPRAEFNGFIKRRLTEPLDKGQWFQDCKEYFIKEEFSRIPKEQLAERLSGLGREARGRIYGLLDDPGNAVRGATTTST